MSKKSDAEKKLAYQMLDVGLPTPETEFEFSDERKWRFDFAWFNIMLAVEVEGGTWNRGRHVRPKGFEDDCIKYNHASLDGWVVLRVTTTMINDGRAIRFIQKAYDYLRHQMDEDNDVYPVD